MSMDDKTRTPKMCPSCGVIHDWSVPCSRPVRTETDDQDEPFPKQSDADADAARDDYAKATRIEEHSPRRKNWQKVKVPEWFAWCLESPLLLYLQLSVRYGDIWANPRAARKALRSWVNMKMKWTDTKSLSEEPITSDAVRQDLHRMDKPSARRLRELEDARERYQAKLRALRAHPHLLEEESKKWSDDEDSKEWSDRDVYNLLVEQTSKNPRK
jgi:hypothetical protein